MPTLLNHVGPLALEQNLLLEVLLQVLINSNNSSTKKPEHARIQSSETHSNSLEFITRTGFENES